MIGRRGRATYVAAVGLLAAGLGLAGIGLHARHAGASFPGRNGLIVFAGNANGYGEIYTVHKDGSHQRRLTHNTGAEDTAPAFSPSGRKIVYTHDTDPSSGSHWELFTMKPDGSHNHRLTQGDTGPFNAAFSPNGRKIVFQSNHGTGMYAINADGTHEHQLTTAGDDLDPSFAPNGKHIVFVHSVNLQFEIFTMKPDGSHFHRLTHNPQQDINPSYSPDGKRIVWSGNRGRPEDILVMDADGKHQRNLTKNDLFEYSPVFSPDGTRIALSSSPVTPGKRGAAGDDAEIFVMDPDGSHRHALTHNQTFDTSPDWQPKRRHRHHQ